MGCTEFPTVDEQPSRGGSIELLETSDNQSNVSHNEPVALEIESMSAAAKPTIGPSVLTNSATATPSSSNSVTARKQRKIR